jgi:hypothetical protein
MGKRRLLQPISTDHVPSKQDVEMSASDAKEALRLLA